MHAGEPKGRPERGPVGRAAGAAATRLPGVALCLAVTLASLAVQRVEERISGHPYVEALVVAILIGMGLRAAWTPGAPWRAGIAFSAKQLLEVAVMMLGASISLAAIVASGPVLLAAVVGTVAATLALSFALARALGLSRRLACLIACGNAICGNSAIAAVAPVIGAAGDEIASAISFTAVLGVMMVLGLPLLIPLLALEPRQYGVLAGLTVYAVPQVLAATVPAGLAATQIGTLVKLVRVLMLGPVVLALSVIARRSSAGQGLAGQGLAGQGVPGRGSAAGRPGVFRLLPWFIVGFLALATLRSAGLVPDAAATRLASVAGLLTVVSMAALGLGVDLRVVSEVGGRVTAAVTLSLAILLLLSLALIRLLHLGT